MAHDGDYNEGIEPEMDYLMRYKASSHRCECHSSDICADEAAVRPQEVHLVCFMSQIAAELCFCEDGMQGFQLRKSRCMRLCPGWEAPHTHSKGHDGKW